MEQDAIDKAFNGRWRIKGILDEEIRKLTGKDVKKMCYDFFKTGIILGEREEEQSISDVDFETWWKMYDKCRDRGKCEKKWAKLSAKEKRDCIAKTPAYVAATPDKQFRRDPATFLNNKSWNNEIITRQPTSQQLQQERLNQAARVIADYDKEDRGTTK